MTEHIQKLWDKAIENKQTFVSKNPGKSYDLKKEECYLEQNASVPILRFEAFREFPFVNAAFSTRLGGVSGGCFGKLNLGFDRGDSRENVEKNYMLFCKSMGIVPESLVLSDQIHETEIHIATKEDACIDGIRKKLQGVDGLMTGQPGLCLATSYADCVPLFFVDGRRRVIASSHSGWRGTVSMMGAKTVAAMERHFSCRREDIIAVIGPSICQECYEVSEDVAEAFRESYDKEQVEELLYCTNEETGKYQLDLWAANYLQLKKAGLLPEHIHVAGLCTCCNHELFFSHRASRGKRGNLNGFIALCD